MIIWADEDTEDEGNHANFKFISADLVWISAD